MLKVNKVGLGSKRKGHHRRPLTWGGVPSCVPQDEGGSTAEVHRAPEALLPGHTAPKNIWPWRLARHLLCDLLQSRPFTDKWIPHGNIRVTGTSCHLLCLGHLPGGLWLAPQLDARGTSKK